MSKNTDSKKLHYVNNAEFLEQMKKHIACVKQCELENSKLPKVSDYIGECIYSIASKLANKPNFVNYPFRDEMISDGIENSLKYINNFDPDKSSNPFAYFTQIIYYAFVRRIKKEKTHLYAKYKLINQKMVDDISEYLHVTKYGSDQADLNMHEFLDNFEKSQEKKKIKAKIVSNRKKNIGFDDIFEQLDQELKLLDIEDENENEEESK